MVIPDGCKVRLRQKHKKFGWLAVDLTKSVPDLGQLNEGFKISSSGKGDAAALGNRETGDKGRQAGSKCTTQSAFHANCPPNDLTEYGFSDRSSCGKTAGNGQRLDDAECKYMNWGPNWNALTDSPLTANGGGTLA